MKKIFALLTSLFLTTVVLTQPLSILHAQSEEFIRGTVLSVLEEQEVVSNGLKGYVQKLEIERQDTKERIVTELGSRLAPLRENQKILPGKQVVLRSLEETDGSSVWVVSDNSYRLPVLAGLLILFFIVVLFVARIQGLLSILGMFLSLGILVFYMIPAILSGTNPIIVSLISSLLIGSCSMYLSHGFKRKSHIAFASMMVTLSVVALVSTLVIYLSAMTGMGSEEAVFLQLEPTIQINLSGLLLGGIMLGALGILDDITISQVSIVQELIQAKPSITFSELFGRGMAVGRDHIASLVNTLVLAYAAGSLPLFLLLTINNSRPLWVMINDEMIAEEVIRTLSGSLGLVLAVPLTTFVAAVVLLRTQAQSK